MADEQVAAVRIDGGILFNIAGIRVYPAEKRAKEIANRIKSLAKDPAFDPSTLQIREEDDASVIATADQKPVMSVLPADLRASGFTSTTPGYAAREVYLKNIVRAI